MINLNSELLEKVDANELYLLCFITNKIGKNKDSWPGNETLKKETGWHIEKLLRVKKSLEDKGIIEVSRKRGFSNRYKLKTSLIKNYYGKSVVPEISNTENPITENPISPYRFSDNEYYGKSDKEELINEELNNEELKSDISLERNKQLIFDELIANIYYDFEKFKHYDSEDIQKVEDQTIRKILINVWGAAEKILSACEKLQRPIPKWQRSTVFGSDDKPNPTRDACNQIMAYTDYCELTKTFVTKDTDKLPERIMQCNWCETLKDYVEQEYKKGRFDPAKFQGEIYSSWVTYLFYKDAMYVLSCKKYSNRLVWGGQEYLLNE